MCVTAYVNCTETNRRKTTARRTKIVNASVFCLLLHVWAEKKTKTKPKLSSMADIAITRGGQGLS